MESVIVFMIVAVVAVIVLRSFYKTVTGKKTGCRCSAKCAEGDCDQGKDNL